MDTEWAKAQNGLHHFYIQEATHIIILMHECIPDYFYGHIQLRETKTMEKISVIWLFLSASLK
jgi:hypothetical protein